MAVSALFRYPVKSMLGEAVERCRIDEGGVLGDRSYALVDVETGAVRRDHLSRWFGAPQRRRRDRRRAERRHRP
jgi:uncharacterized protein YcbX